MMTPANEIISDLFKACVIIITALLLDLVSCFPAGMN